MLRILLRVSHLVRLRRLSGFGRYGSACWRYHPTGTGNGEHVGARLIAEYIRLLQEKRLEAVRSLVPELKQFLFRRNAATAVSRTSVFIQMLLLVSEADFQPDGVSRLVAGHLEHLHTFPLDLATPTLELEVLPYEDLWQIILQTLEAGANRQ